jgi:hypothetical protein
LLELDDRDMRPVPIEERKATLAKLLRRAPDHLRARMCALGARASKAIGIAVSRRACGRDDRGRKPIKPCAIAMKDGRAESFQS